MIRQPKTCLSLIARNQMISISIPLSSRISNLRDISIIRQSPLSNKIFTAQLTITLILEILIKTEINQISTFLI